MNSNDYKEMANVIRRFLENKDVCDFVNDLHRVEFPGDSHEHISISIDATATYVQTFMAVTAHGCSSEDAEKRKEILKSVELVNYIFEGSYFQGVSLNDKLEALRKSGFRVGSIVVYVPS